MKKITSAFILILGMTLYSNAAITGFHGLIINNSSNALAERIVDLLTPRWHFSNAVATGNLVIEDINGGPASQKIAFTYDGQIIKRYSLPRAKIKPENLKKLADEVYEKTLRIDNEKRSAVLERLDWKP